LCVVVKHYMMSDGISHLWSN